MITIEHWVDDHTVLIGDFKTTDESYDHEFGVKRQYGYELVKFSVLVYIGGTDYDITKALKDKELNYFKDILVKRYETDCVAAC